jgi:hypothetical protein
MILRKFYLPEEDVEDIDKDGTGLFPIETRV